jgi:putative phosphoribosyl transferase
LLHLGGMRSRFAHRAAAGEALAYAVADAVDGAAVVLGVPNGGLAVAQPIAAALRAPLGVAWVRKLVLPREPDVVVGAVDLDGDVTLVAEAVRAQALDGETVTELAFHAHQRLRDAATPLPPDLHGKSAVVVDDGMTTGIALAAALRWARRHRARRVVVAVPVVDARIWERVAKDADQAVTLEIRDDGPIARSEVYDDFRRVGREELDRLLGNRAPTRLSNLQNAR